MCLFIIVIGNFFLFISGGNQKDIGQNHHGVCVFCCFVGFSWRGNQRNVTFPYLNKIKSGVSFISQISGLGELLPLPDSQVGEEGWFYSKDIREQAFLIPVKIYPVQVLQVGSHGPSRLSGDIRDLLSWLLLGPSVQPSSLSCWCPIRIQHFYSVRHCGPLTL